MADTGFGQSFDTFLEATAQAAIEHVVGAAKGILQSVTIYVVGERSLEYNDEYHYFEGEGIIPKAFFLDREAANADARRRTLKFFNESGAYGWGSNSVLEIGGSYDNDEIKEFVVDEMGVAEDDVWEVKYSQFIDFCTAKNIEPLDHLPPMYEVVEVNPG